ncbi:MAG: 3-deoxy-7-phosphoheptulonate synthase [Verrucomicrobia bacterium]|nr:3-deoxy-7-phosphoheptulonate synthase [Verrucomicrobiota bacterium]MDE3047553.1 3-deoxy-7-phosphoheptulonate synthase [Verrucomicrobiota bacterium]
MQLPTPAQIKRDIPLTVPAHIASWRRVAIDILERRDPRLALIVGPCSIHDADAVYEYGLRLKALLPEIEHAFFPIMRLFFEKPRTQLGWKGMLYDPHLDGSHDIEAGLRKARALILKIAELGIPCAAELLEPLAVPYFDDLIVWGMIGARTSASQPHRQLVSGLPFPVGFKNDTRGDLDTAIAGILSSRIAHSHLGIDAGGRISKIQTQGNRYTHLVLRGSDRGPNYDAHSIETALKSLQEQRLEPRLIIDCSHGNCGRDPQRQKSAFQSVTDQAMRNTAICGLMLESHLLPGKQPLGDDPHHLHYGISITDPCLGWDETAELLRSTSISFVQN